VIGARRELLVERAGPLTTVQDAGRSGVAHLGVPTSGAADRRAFGLANRLVGNAATAAALEVTLGGLVLRPAADVVAAVTGAACPVTVDGRSVGRNAVLQVPGGARLALGTASAGLRAYLAVRGGFAVTPVLGSRSTDLLSGLGPPALVDGDVLPIGELVDGWPRVDQAPVAEPTGGQVLLRAVPGPRADWLSGAGLLRLWSATWTVTADSDRVGLRLQADGVRLERSRTGELPSEGLVRGAVQVPPSGEPVLFLADHPVTGGYPVAAVVIARDADLAGQVRPGQRVRFVAVPAPPI
jgi:biotin-dependent carboxylase-like uncharacterized protein